MKDDNEIKIEEMDFSVRTFSRLEFAKIKTLADLKKADLSKIRNLAKICQKEIEEKIREYEEQK